jgi:hypothetical protein
MAATSEIKTLLGQMQITNTDVWLNISLKTTLTDLQSLSKSLPSSSSSTSTTTTIVMPTKVK